MGQGFRESPPGKILQERMAEDVEAFLSRLASQPQFAEWQAKKARHALRPIYEAFLPLYAPATSHGAQVSKRVQKAAAGFRNQVIPGDARALQGMEGNMAESGMDSFPTEESYLMIMFGALASSAADPG
jgi:hypothetical protein